MQNFTEESLQCYFKLEGHLETSRNKRIIYNYASLMHRTQPTIYFHFVLALFYNDRNSFQGTLGSEDTLQLHKNLNGGMRERR